MDARPYYPVLESSNGTHTPLPSDPMLSSDGLSRTVRSTPPANYTFKVESISTLLDMVVAGKLERCESSVFDAGSYKWRLHLYPAGDMKNMGDGHISLYLEAAETNKLPRWEINVNFKLFVYNHIQEKYYTVQGGKKWEMEAFPRGRRREGKYLSVYLRMVDSRSYFNFDFLRWSRKDDGATFSHKGDIYAESMIVVRGRPDSNRYQTKKVNGTFRAKSGMGHDDFMLLSDLTEASNEFLINDTLVIEVYFEVINEIKTF
ncbi:hypothetical protein RJ639_047294 [Escallonia herrerae]|uniref:MATH domain-containing protein n=1 Tax=Escallonia herrerae TaxID=1293975 RepID=A0AA89B0Y3_9ASTE|nr:hypothetical protein RJ639_047294 [Escallonia herrerae]